MVSVKPSLDTTAPFTRAEARLRGITDRELRGPRFQRVFYDVYVGAGVSLTPLVRARAALKVSPSGTFVSHFTAAEIWGGCPPAQPDTHISTAAGAVRQRRRGLTAHLANAAAEVVAHQGLRISSPAQSFLDLAARLALVDLVVVGDALVRAGHASPGDLVRAADGWRGHGARLARRAARLVRDGVDSPMETRLRLLLVLAGLPEPEVNVIIRDTHGNWVLRFDLCYRHLKLIIEYDGRQHAEDDTQWDRDIQRRETLDRHGWRILVIRAKDIYTNPERTLDRVTDALRERGATDLRRRYTSEWRRHFPGRAAA